MTAPTPQQMRDMGYSADAVPTRLSPRAWIAFCAWINAEPTKAPPQMRFHPPETAAAWERVAAHLSWFVEHGGLS